MISAAPHPSAVARIIRARQTCFCRLLQSATTAAKRSRSAGLTSTLIPSRIGHCRTRHANMEFVSHTPVPKSALLKDAA
jgi:hypothetical protein